MVQSHRILEIEEREKLKGLIFFVLPNYDNISNDDELNIRGPYIDDNIFMTMKNSTQSSFWKGFPRFKY